MQIVANRYTVKAWHSDGTWIGQSEEVARTALDALIEACPPLIGEPGLKKLCKFGGTTLFVEGGTIYTVTRDDRPRDKQPRDP